METPSSRIPLSPERDTEFQWKENVCNWCGSSNIKMVYRVFGNDLWHDIYECEDCHHYTWHHVYWSKCWRNTDGSFTGW